MLFTLSRVTLFLCLGATLLSAPWGALWHHNALLAHNALAFAVTQNYFLRGAVSGVGLTNFWLALDEIRQLSAPAGPAR
jgi:hypothetical protein